MVAILRHDLAGIGDDGLLVPVASSIRLAQERPHNRECKVGILPLGDPYKRSWMSLSGECHSLCVVGGSWNQVGHLRSPQTRGSREGN